MRTHSTALVCAVLATTSGARGDWPIARHDPARTGAAPGSSDISGPSAVFRAYLGGSLLRNAVVLADVDGNGVDDFLIAVAGRVIAKRGLSDTTLWQSESLDIQQVAAVTDLDGDGEKEVVVGTRSRILVLSAKTGALRWSQPAGEFGTLGGIRLADLDGDGRLDVIGVECGCCALLGTTGAVARSFGKGVTAPAVLWTLPSLVCGGVRSVVDFDGDGDGLHEVLTPTATGLRVVDAKTGTPVGAETLTGAFAGANLCTAVPLDARPGAELLCLQNVVGATPSGRRLSVISFDRAKTAVSVLWTHDVGTTDGAVTVVPEVTTDMDGDGTLDVIASGVGAAGPVTELIDGRSGAAWATVDGTAIGVGATPTGPVLLVQQGASVTALSFAKRVTSKSWTLGDARVIERIRPGDLLGQGLASGSPSIDLGQPSFLLSRPGRVDAVRAVDGSTTATLTVSGLGKPSWFLDWNGQLALETTDGLLRGLDVKLKPAPAATIRHGGFSTDLAARNFGAGPVTGKLDKGYESIIVATSSGSLARFDAQDGSFAYPPIPVWERANASAPAIGPGATVLCKTASTTNVFDTLTNIGADGITRWSRPLGGTILNDIVPSPSGDRVFVQWGAVGDVLVHTEAISTAGTPIWSALPRDPGAGRQPLGMSAFAWNSDDTQADVVFQARGTLVLSGASGALLASGGPADDYLLATRLVASGAPTLPGVLFSGGNGPVQSWAHDLATMQYKAATDEKALPFAALATCADQRVAVYSTWSARSTLTITNLVTGVSKAVELVAGSVGPSSGPVGGQLGSPAVHADAAGRALAVVGSSDGWLYGVAVCTGSLVFSRDLGVPVGDPIFSDFDGDGQDDLLVSAADGYLYGLKQTGVGAPPSVVDTLPGSISSDDVDETLDLTGLGIRWTPVPEAEAYEVAVVRADGSSALPTRWLRVGNVDHVDVRFTLVAGETYHSFVRAIRLDKPGPDKGSDGVLAIAPVGPAPDAGLDGGDTGDATVPIAEVAGGGCACRTSVPVSTSNQLPLLCGIAAAAVGQRRKRLPHVRHRSHRRGQP